MTAGLAPARLEESPDTAGQDAGASQEAKADGKWHRKQTATRRILRRRREVRVKRWGKSPPATAATRRLAKPRPVQGEQGPTRGCPPRARVAAKRDGHPRQNPAYRPAKGKASETGLFLWTRFAGDDESADEATVKTFYREDGRIRLQPENASQAPIYADYVHVLGRVVGVFREL